MSAAVSNARSVAPASELTSTYGDRSEKDCLSTAARDDGPRERSEGFEDERDPLPTADAHRHEAVALLVPTERVGARDREDGAGRAERVTERDRAAKRVPLLRT